MYSRRTATRRAPVRRAYGARRSLARRPYGVRRRPRPLAGRRAYKGRGLYSVGGRFTRGNLMPVVPQIRNKGKEGEIYVAHKEYLGDVVSSKLHKIQFALALNPALYGTFPWLSSLASSFQQHSAVGLMFTFVSTCGTAVSGTNPALGSVNMATQYDSVAGPFTTKQEMLNTEFAVSSVPSRNVTHAIECAPRSSTIDLLYTREAAPSGSSDIRLYDLGIFCLSTDGCPADGSVLGELWVTYNYKLCKPILSGDPVLAGSLMMYKTVGGERIATIDNEHLFGAQVTGIPPTVTQVPWDQSSTGVLASTLKNNQFPYFDANDVYFNNFSVRDQYWVLTYSVSAQSAGTTIMDLPTVTVTPPNGDDDPFKLLSPVVTQQGAQATTTAMILYIAHTEFVFPLSPVC